MKTTAKRKKIIKRTLLKPIKRTLAFIFITMPRAISKIIKTLENSIVDFTKINKNTKGRLVGDIFRVLGVITIGLLTFAYFAAIIGIFVWMSCYIAYSINPELCDIILDFTGNLYEYFNK